jgi:uncharacterized protein (TIGR02145 family)
MLENSIFVFQRIAGKSKFLILATMKHRFGACYVPMMMVCVFYILSGGCKKKDSSNDSQAATVKDIDGNVYRTVVIGSQVWMAENLKVVRYRNGDAISYITNNGTWAGMTEGAYSNYDNDASLGSQYGRLYNFYAVTDPRNIAPSGWHVPTENDWQVLVSFLGGENIAGGKLKESGTAHWNAPNTGATNQSGFCSLPGGVRSRLDGSFAEMGISAVYWSSTSDGITGGWGRHLSYIIEAINSNSYPNAYGFSVLCVKD